MGIEPFLLSSSVILVMAQRVMRRLNPEMSEEYKPSEMEIKALSAVLGDHLAQWLHDKGMTLEQLRLRRPRADLVSKDDAYKGRVAIFEIMPISLKMQELITKNLPAQEIEREALGEGMLLMKQDGFIKVLEGMSTIEEVLRVAET
jgi:type IV pilus assembly protein PilB